MRGRGYSWLEGCFLFGAGLEGCRRVCGLVVCWEMLVRFFGRCSGGEWSFCGVVFIFGIVSFVVGFIFIKVMYLSEYRLYLV